MPRSSAAVHLGRAVNPFRLKARGRVRAVVSVDDEIVARAGVCLDDRLVVAGGIFRQHDVSLFGRDDVQQNLRGAGRPHAKLAAPRCDHVRAQWWLRGG